jgi:hypothetical protein
VKLPLKKNAWYHTLDSNRSIAEESRSIVMRGDLFVLGLLLWSAYRLVGNYESGAYRTHLTSGLRGYPPAVIANNFDFENTESNRRVSRAELDSYRAEVVGVRATAGKIEDIIFKY